MYVHSNDNNMDISTSKLISNLLDIIIMHVLNNIITQWVKFEF